MLTDYQIGRIRQFTDSVRAGTTEHPEQVLLELADLLDLLVADELDHRERVMRIDLAFFRLAEQSNRALLATFGHDSEQ